MKLVDILARELEEWPEGASHAVCPGLNGNGKFHASYTQRGAPVPDRHDKEHTWTICDYNVDASVRWLGVSTTLSKGPEDRKTAIVTHAQWQAAVEALKSPSLHIQQIGRITRQQETIDWSKAPDWAGAVIKNPSDDYYWVSQFGGISCRQRVGAIEPDDTSACMREGSLWTLVAERQSVAWNGEGLPPVGLKVEGLIQGNGDWCELTLKYKSTDFSVFERADGEEFPLWNPQYSTFRPLRTPEQISAEEREKAIEEMVALSPMLDKGWARKVCTAVYDAGYRKQVQP